MLHEFLASHREAIVARVRDRVDSRRGARATNGDADGVPVFLAQVGRALEEKAVATRAFSESASQVAASLLREGFTISQVVHGYGDVCQVVTGLALELDAPITTEEFRTLNLCLDEAIAGAVAEFSRLREASIGGAGTDRLAYLAQEIRNLIGSAQLSFELLRSGTVPIAGSTGAILGRSLGRVRALADRSLAEARLESGLEKDEILVSELVELMELAATASAQLRGVHLDVTDPPSGRRVLGDRYLLGAVLDNVVQNAIRFTPPGGRVTVTGRDVEEGVVLDVADGCGGLDEAAIARVFVPAADSRRPGGLGIGMAIARKGMRAMGGDLTVRSVPGAGCVFTLRLPQVGRS